MREKSNLALDAETVHSIPRLDEVDLTDPTLYAFGDPHAVFSLLRAEAPVFWNREANGPGFWALTRYDDIARVYRDPATFRSEYGTILTTHRDKPDPAAGKMLALTDPPRHPKLRQPIYRGFTPHMVERLEQRVRATVDALLDEALDRGSCDFVTDVSAHLPVTVMCEMMGVPRADWDLMLDLTRTAFSADDPEYQIAASGGMTASQAHNEILLYFADLAVERRDDPGEDLVSILATMEVDGQPLSDEEVLLNCDNLIVGGNETMRHTAAGGLLALLDHPAEWARLEREPELLASAIEEILRWTSPGMHVLRTAKHDTLIRGQTIKAGQQIAMWTPSANRDEAVFADPFRFDVARSPNRHLTFGLGAHYCLGASLTRMELRTLFQQLLARTAQVALAGPIERLRSNLIAGFKHMPITIQPRA